MGALNIPIKLLLLSFFIATSNSSPIKTRLSKSSQNAPRHPFASLSSIKTVSTTTSPIAQTSEHGRNSQRKTISFGSRVGVKTSQLFQKKQFTQQDHSTVQIEQHQATTTTPVPEVINPIRIKTVKSANPPPIIQHHQVPTDSHVQQEVIPAVSNFGTRIPSNAENACNVKGNCGHQSNSANTDRRDFGESFVSKPKDSEKHNAAPSQVKGHPLKQEEVKGNEEDNSHSQDNYEHVITEAHSPSTFSTESNIDFAIPSKTNAGTVKTIPSVANVGHSIGKTIPSVTKVAQNPTKTNSASSNTDHHTIKTAPSSTNVGHNPTKTVLSSTNVEHNPTQTVSPSINVSRNPVKTIRSDQHLHSAFEPVGAERHANPNDHSVKGVKTSVHNNFQGHPPITQQQQDNDDVKQLTLAQQFVSGGYEGLIPAHGTSFSVNDQQTSNDQPINQNFAPTDTQQEFVGQVRIPADKNIHQYEDDGQYYSSLSPLEALLYNVPGNPGEDYPILYQVPDTSFSCEQQPYQAGIYGDMDAACQVFHICKENGGQDSFLCPNGTVFNQQFFVCDWWYNYNCSETSRFYNLNAHLYLDIDSFTPSKIQTGEMAPVTFQANQESIDEQSIVETNFQSNDAGVSAEFPDSRSHSSDASNLENIQQNVNFEMQGPVENSFDEQQVAGAPINQQFITDFNFNDNNQKSEISRPDEAPAQNTKTDDPSFLSKKSASSSSTTHEIPKQQEILKDFVDSFNQDVYDYEQKMISDSLGLTPEQVLISDIPSFSQQEEPVEIKNDSQEEQQAHIIEGIVPNQAIVEQTPVKLAEDFKPNQMPEAVVFPSSQNDHEQQEVGAIPMSSDSGRDNRPDNMDGTNYPDQSGYVQKYEDDDKAPLSQMPQDYNRGTYQFDGGAGSTFKAQEFPAQEVVEHSVFNFGSMPSAFSSNAKDSVQEHLNEDSIFTQNQENSNPSFESFQPTVQRGSEEGSVKTVFSAEDIQQDPNKEPVPQQEPVIVEQHSLTINHTESISGNRPHQNLPALPSFNKAQNSPAKTNFKVQQMEYEPQPEQPQNFLNENIGNNRFLKPEVPNKSDERQNFGKTNRNSNENIHLEQMYIQQQHEEINAPSVTLQRNEHGLKQLDKSVQEQVQTTIENQNPTIRLSDMVRGKKNNAEDYHKNNAEQQQRFNFRPQEQQHIGIAFAEQTQQPENSYENNYATQQPSTFNDQRNEQSMYPVQVDISNQGQGVEDGSSQVMEDYPTENQDNTFQNTDVNNREHGYDRNKIQKTNTKDYYNQRFIHFQQEQPEQLRQEPEIYNNGNSDFPLNQERVRFPETTKNINFNQDSGSQSFPNYPTNQGPSNQHFFLTNAHQRPNQQNLREDRPANHYGNQHQQFSNTPNHPQVISQQRVFNDPQQNFGVKGNHNQERNGRNLFNNVPQNPQNIEHQRINGNDGRTYSQPFSVPSEAAISYNGWRPVVRE